MSDNVIQTSFNSGEWAPDLNARVDLAKYHSGAALLRNFTVDYRGGATTRPGTKYILQTFSPLTVRLIGFQVSFSVDYVLEFGHGYLRFFNNGVPVLEPATTITGITRANPAVVTDPGHGYTTNDTILISSVVGMTQVNGNYYNITVINANSYSLNDLNNIPINSTTFNTYTSGGTAQRVYRIGSPYLYSELAALKFVQNVNQMYICHPNYPPYVLTLITATNWTLAPIVIGTTILPPASVTLASTLAAGAVFYAYKVTAVDINGQESAPTAPFSTSGLQDLRSTPGSNSIQWSASVGATSYNVYKAIPSYFGAPPAGAPFGFIGNATGLQLIDSNITADFSQGPPIPQNPFSGSGVATITLTATGGAYTSVPSVTLTAPPPGGSQALATLGMNIPTISRIALANGGNFYAVNDTVQLYGGIIIRVTSITFGGVINGFSLVNNGNVSIGSLPTVNVSQTSTSGAGSGALFNLDWGVFQVAITSPGSGYLVAPSVTFSSSGGSGAAATTTLGAASAGNPTVPGLFQQRLALTGLVLSPGEMNFSQPGALFDFDTSFPLQADDAIQETLTSTTLNTIKALVPVSAGLMVLTDKGAWLVNGGSAGAPISALSIVANSQGYAGCADLPPIATPADILYVQAKGSIVRDLAYNFYLNNYVGTDISILSSHLFYGFTLKEWAWAEEPFKTVWVVRNDGQLLSLCFVKDQQMIAWSHHDTQGAFQSIATVPEPTAIGTVDAIYHVVRRTINGFTVQYIERNVELNYPSDYKSSWQVDAGIGYNGAAATTFSGAQHLAGAAVTGVADGAVINFTMPVSGTFVFGPGGTTGLTAIPNASIVTVGLAFTPQLQTLALDLGQPTVQGKRKKVSAVTVRTKNALGLSAGRTFATAVAMKDLALGNVGTMSNALVTGLQTTDARTIVDPQWDVFGQFCIQQSNPYPAQVLGVVPEIEVGDTTK